MTGADFLAWRKAQGMTQGDAGDRLGVTRRTVQLYEAGEQPIPRTVALACRAIAEGWADFAERAETELGAS
ncbi:hypothetical protein TSH64_01070 [Azospirillum sp. TSH64]|nr:hypothetical protein TSH64_01070 [Azospirillum sp. TSH64]